MCVRVVQRAGVQRSLNACTHLQTPNALSPAHGEAFALFSANRAEYEKRVREQARARAGAGAS